MDSTCYYQHNFLIKKKEEKISGEKHGHDSVICIFHDYGLLFIFLLQAMDSQQNMKDNAGKTCSRQITLPQENNAK
jgi:hypothetical protein